MTHEDKGSREAIDKLPDRIIESRKGDYADPDRNAKSHIQKADTRKGQEGQGDKRG